MLKASFLLLVFTRPFEQLLFLKASKSRGTRVNGRVWEGARKRVAKAGTKHAVLKELSRTYHLNEVRHDSILAEVLRENLVRLVLKGYPWAFPGLCLSLSSVS
jgi:hypothetical protein